MGLFGRSGGALVTVTPATVRPRQTVTATVTVDKPIDRVGSVRLEWGYDNFYRYHWAGRADSVGNAGNDSLLLAGQVGTSYGSERDTDDWVCVTKTEIDSAGAEFTGTSSSFTIPSWAPGSSPELARWACRLLIERGGIDVDQRGVFSVVIGASDVDPIEAALQPVEHYLGGRDSELDIALATAVWRAGEPVTGHVVVKALQNLPDADITVYWQRERQHHPLERYPAQDGTLDGPPVHLGRKIPMHGGYEFGLPFELPLPPDAAPSGEAVHSSVSWFVGARIFYSGFTQHQFQRSRKPIVVVNAL